MSFSFITISSRSIALSCRVLCCGCIGQHSLEFLGYVWGCGQYCSIVGFFNCCCSVIVVILSLFILSGSEFKYYIFLEKDNF